MNTQIMRSLGFGEMVDRFEKGLCPHCGHKVNPAEFRDERCAREFRVSGSCQSCQDRIDEVLKRMEDE